jgi:rhamnulokinase
MTHTLDLLAFDIGASGGRAILGRFDGESLTLHEVHRFPNGPVARADGPHWDVEALFQEIKRGMALCVERLGKPVSVGIDTWGIDFALLDERGELLDQPCHYRHPRTKGIMEKAFHRVARRDIYEQTGIQFLPFNTLYQLFAMSLARSPQLRQAKTFLMIPDYLNYRLAGRAVCEFTDATTTQFYDTRRGEWAGSLLERLDIPAHFLPEVVQPGTVLGPLLPSLAAEAGAEDTSVIAPACHDTGSAVAAVPAMGEEFAYISSGTWSLVGVETREPVVTDASLAANLTNEGGVEGRIRLLRNVAGLWPLQECRRIWAERGRAYSYDELVAMAKRAPPFVSLLDPDNPAFLDPPDMLEAIGEECRRRQRREPREPGEIVRCILEGLALKYRWVLERIQAVRSVPIDVVHIIGGGCQNELLCQFTADATGRPVTAGPVEGTATGNVIVQAMALGHLASLEEARALVCRSFDLRTYEPGERAPWDDAYNKMFEVG